MPADKIDAEELRRNANALAVRLRNDGMSFDEAMRNRDEFMIRAAMGECAKVCESISKDIVCPEECAAAIRERKP